MSKWRVLIYIVLVVNAFCAGLYTMKGWQDRWYAQHPAIVCDRTASIIVNSGQKNVCGNDGRWWPARADGQCYLADEPHNSFLLGVCQDGNDGPIGCSSVEVPAQNKTGGKP